MSERELQGHGGQWHVELGAQVLQPTHPRNNLLGRRLQPVSIRTAERMGTGLRTL